jgi:hypothetical protein
VATEYLSATNRIYRVTALTDGANISVSADTTDLGTVTLGGNRTMDNPTGSPYNGQRLSFRISQDGTGNRTLAWGNKYSFQRAAAAHFLAQAASTVTTYEFQYDSVADLWRHMPDANWGCSWGVQGYAQTTSSTTSIPSDGVGTVILLLEDVPVKDGRTYQVIGHGEIESDTAVPSRSESHIKYTTDGSTPDASDPNLTRELSSHTDLDIPSTVHMVSIYRATSNHNLSVALHAQGVYDAGHSYTYYADANTPIYLSIEDVGPDPT